MPEADEDIRQALEDLRCLEAERCPSMDRAADTSSRMTAAVVPRTGDTRERILHQMFYQIGRWIYIVDAVQDIKRIWKRTATIRSFCGMNCKRRTSLR